MNRDRQIVIEKDVENIRNKCGVTDYGFKDIFEASEKLGYRTIRYPVGSEAFLGFALIRDSERIVFSNSSLILSREIFTVAHEIGHQVLHLSEQGRTLIKDDDFSDRDESEVEANYFAACLLMPADKVEKFIRLELKGKGTGKWDGLDIAKIQTAFSVSYDMVLVRLRALGFLNDSIVEKLRQEKIELTAYNLLNVIGGNTGLCRSTGVKRIPADFLEWVIANYNEKLIPRNSLEAALKYVDINADDIITSEDKQEEDSFDSLLNGMD